MSNASSLAKRALPDALPAAPSDVSHIRPKVMRRPTQFSALRPPPAVDAAAPSPAAEAPLEEKLPLPNPFPVAVAEPASRAWQDDARFGVVMLVIVIAINLALMLWLPQLKQPTPPTSPQEAAQEHTAPRPAGVTLYTKPEPAHLHPSALIDEDVLAPLTAEEAPIHILGGSDTGPAQ